jgi:hypothetical protein
LEGASDVDVPNELLLGVPSRELGTDVEFGVLCPSLVRVLDRLVASGCSDIRLVACDCGGSVVDDVSKGSVVREVILGSGSEMRKPKCCYETRSEVKSTRPFT